MNKLSSSVNEFNFERTTCIYACRIRNSHSVVPGKFASAMPRHPDVLKACCVRCLRNRPALLLLVLLDVPLWLSLLVQCCASLPDILRTCPLASLTVKHNCLTNESLPKSFFHPAGTLKELNLSGNMLESFPEQLLELSSLKYLFLGANNISNVPKDVWKMSSLQILMLAGNRIVDIPDSVGLLKSLQMLVLNENLIEQLPASIGKLNHLKCLRLHNNRLRTLPTEIITLKCLTELSLRDNPLVVRFVKDITLQPPTLLELAARTVKLHHFCLRPGDIPACLLEYLEQAHCCVNPKCKGVFFDSRVEHIKFVDFCGKYRLPLLQYLCSSRCITGSWESREHDPVARGFMMKKVLLG